MSERILVQGFHLVNTRLGVWDVEGEVERAGMGENNTEEHVVERDLYDIN